MFNFNLYKEGLRKTRTLAFLFLAVMLLAAIFQPITHLMNHSEAVRNGWHWARSPIHIHGISAYVMAPFAFFVGAPILTLSMFSFLAKRSSSDFYHAIPHRRSTLFVSFIAAVLTWVVGGMWISTAISTAIYATSSYTVVDFGSVVLTQIGLAAACFLVVATFALAVSITGTKLSSLMTGLLILFVPRLITTLFLSFVASETRIVSLPDFGFFGAVSRHIPFGFFSHWIVGESLYEAIVRGTFYTFILAIIYLIVGGYLFVKRHSETAESPGTKWSQPIIRIVVAFLVTVPALGIIMDRSYFGHNAEFFSIIVIVYSVALVTYFAYEFITARKIPKLTKMLPGIAVVILLNIVFLGGVVASREIILRQINTASISSITIEEMNTNHWGRGYADLNVRGLTINDEDIAVFFVDTLNANVRDSRQVGNRWWHGTEMRITFHVDGGRDITRTIRVRDHNIENLAALMVDYEPYQNIVLMTPENPDTISLGNFQYSSHDFWIDLPDVALRELYDIFREEIQNVDFRLWYGLVGPLNQDFDFADNEPPTDSSIVIIFGEIQITGTANGPAYRSHFPITELTPRTLERFLELTER